MEALLHLAVVVNAAIVVLEEVLAQQVRPARLDGREIQELQDHLDSLVSPNKLLANK